MTVQIHKKTIKNTKLNDLMGIKVELPSKQNAFNLCEPMKQMQNVKIIVNATMTNIVIGVIRNNYL